MAFERKLANLTVKVLKGNLLEVEAEALVNPANSLLIMGGGVAGAIKR
ncbi:macro domain-containing protein, partial [Candidatus Bathyarchaeota archaeon]